MECRFGFTIVFWAEAGVALLPGGVPATTVRSVGPVFVAACGSITTVFAPTPPLRAGTVTMRFALRNGTCCWTSSEGSASPAGKGERRPIDAPSRAETAATATTVAALQNNWLL